MNEFILNNVSESPSSLLCMIFILFNIIIEKLKLLPIVLVTNVHSLAYWEASKLLQ